MNYDFTETESTFFSELSEKVHSLGDITPFECRDPSCNAHHVNRMLETLANTPYLRLGLQSFEGLCGHLTLMGAMEILAGFSPSAYLTVEASNRLFGRAVNQWANQRQKQRYLEPILEGKRIGALALSETSMNIENDPLETVGEKGEDSISVSGVKQYVINAPIADWIAVAGMCEGQFALFILERQTPGLIIDPPLETVGYQGTPISSVTLDQCNIPEEQVITSASGDNIPAVLRMWENQILLGVSLGIAQTAFDTARDYAKSHQSGGKPIIAYQEVGFKLAEMLTLLQTAQLLAYRSAWMLETGDNEAKELLLSAKVFSTESAEQICSDALKILGGRGYICGNQAEQAYRCAKFGQVAGTSTEISRVQIGNAALGSKN